MNCESAYIPVPADHWSRCVKPVNPRTLALSTSPLSAGVGSVNTFAGGAPCADLSRAAGKSTFLCLGPFRDSARVLERVPGAVRVAVPAKDKLSLDACFFSFLVRAVGTIKLAKRIPPPIMLPTFIHVTFHL